MRAIEPTLDETNTIRAAAAARRSGNIAGLFAYLACRLHRPQPKWLPPWFDFVG